MIAGETITYPGISTCVVQKQLELQEWIINPDSRPYESENKLIARSAGVNNVEVQTKSTVEKQLELQRMIVGEYYHT